MKIWIIRAITILCYLNFAVGCATIVHGVDQNVDINSSPQGAEVWIDGSMHGKTPAKVNLTRKNDYYLIIKKEGFEDSSTKIGRETSGWVLANALLGGLIGCAIDYSSGGAYNLVPEKLDITLTKREPANLVSGKAKLYEMPSFLELELNHNFQKLLFDGKVALMYKHFIFRESVIQGTGILGFAENINEEFSKTSYYVSEGDIFYMQVDPNIIYEIEVVLEQDKKLLLNFTKLLRGNIE